MKEKVKYYRLQVDLNSYEMKKIETIKTILEIDTKSEVFIHGLSILQWIFNEYKKNNSIFTAYQKDIVKSKLTKVNFNDIKIQKKQKIIDLEQSNNNLQENDKKHRFQIDLSDPEFRKIEALQESLGFRTKKEIFKRCISVLEWVLITQGAGKDIYSGKDDESTNNTEKKQKEEFSIPIN